jgi:sugar phosphate isomerase/epimerase
MILSVPSYVIPGTYGENVAFLADFPEIGGVELLFYYFDDESRDLFIREKSQIASFGERFSFAVHMPDSPRREHEQLIELTRDLAGRYILHPPTADLDRFRDMVENWQKQYGAVFLVENLIAGDFSRTAELMDTVPLCCDTGHLLRAGLDVSEFLAAYRERVREIHLHGVIDGQDHRAFHADEAWFRAILPYLRSFDGVLNLEVFSIGEVNELVTVLKQTGVLSEAGC